MLKTILRSIAHRTGKLSWLYARVVNPDGIEWASYLKKWGGIKAMGRHCYISRDVVIPDPYLLRIGDNVRMTGCTVFGHDGSVNMINRAFGTKLDNVGPVEIGSNVFIGYRAIVMPNVRIGNNVIVGAGAVVTRDVPDNSLVAGAPARRVCSLDDVVSKLREKNQSFPWLSVIEKRGGGYDPALEPVLRRLRDWHFFGAPAG